MLCSNNNFLMQVYIQHVFDEQKGNFNHFNELKPEFRASFLGL